MDTRPCSAAATEIYEPAIHCSMWWYIQSGVKLLGGMGGPCFCFYYEFRVVVHSKVFASGPPSPFSCRNRNSRGRQTDSHVMHMTACVHLCYTYFCHYSTVVSAGVRFFPAQTRHVCQCYL